MDDLDRAEAIEAQERERVLRAHANRPRIVPDCESCGDVPAHVTANGTIWRFCEDCAADHLAARKAA